MILDKLSLHNFGIYKGLQEFDLRTKGKNKPIILIGAMNGSGKTTFLQSIDFVLYGKNSNVFKSQNLAYDKFLEKNIHKDQVDEGAQITIEFNRLNKGEEENFRLIRSWKKSGGKMKESFSVFVNNTLDELVTKDWDNFIEQILPPKVAQLFFFDGEKIEELADLEQSKDVLKKSVDSLLGLEIVSRLEDDLNDFRKKSSISIKDEGEKKIIEDLTKKAEFIDQQINELEERKVKIEDAISVNNYAISETEQELEKSGFEFFTKKQEYENQIIQKEFILKSVNQGFMESVCSEGPLLLIQNEIKELKERYENDLLLNKNQQSIDITNELVDEIDQFINKFCLDADFKNKSKKFLQEKIVTNTDHPQSFASIVGLDKYVFDNLLNNVLPRIDKSNKNNIKSYEQTSEEIETIRFKIKKIPSDDKIKPIIKKQEELKKNAIGLQAQYNQLMSQISSKQFEKQPIDIQLRKLFEIQSQKETDLLDAERFVLYSEKTILIMEQFKQKVLQYHIHKLENEIATCFNILIRKKDFLNKVKINTQTFELLLFDKKDRVIETQQLSAGERQLLAVSILWALARASNNSSPTIIDTPLGRLDSKHRLNLVEKYFPQASHQVILLSTDEEINQNYHSKLKNSIARSYLINFDAKSNGSKVEEGYFFNATI